METNFQSNPEQPVPQQPEVPAQNAGNAPQPENNKKFPMGLVIGIIAAAVIIAGILIAMTFFKSSPNETQLPAGSGTPLPSDQSYQQLPSSLDMDSTAAISQQINDTVVNDVDSQFKDIDAELNQL
jgi:cytoskeletal protein RodZ